MVDYNEVDAYGAEGDYVLNRARLYRDRRDFVIQAGDTGEEGRLPGGGGAGVSVYMDVLDRRVIEWLRLILCWRTSSWISS